MGDLMDSARLLAGQPAPRESGIFRTLKQTWFGPMAGAQVATLA